jgi:hypothetical protein
MGMNDYYDDHFKKNLEYYKHKSAEDNAKAFFQLFANDFKAIPRSRFESLSLDSSTANNKSEQLYKNILTVFRKIHYDSYERFQLNVVEIRELINYLFKDVCDLPRYRKFSKKKSLFNAQTVSLREVLENYLDQVNKLIDESTIEPMFLFVNFMVDYINMKIYDFEYNDIIAILIFYILMIDNDMRVSYYIGFFPKLITKKDQFLKFVQQTSFQWDDGLSDVMPLLKFLIAIYKEMYEDIRDLSRDFEFDKETTILKTDFVENIILKMPETFSKKDIRKKYPHVSDSTINRTLKRLQEEDKIRSLGKGRSAKWVKIIENDDVKGQLKLFLNEKE